MARTPRQRSTAARRRVEGGAHAVEARFVARMVQIRKQQQLTAVQLVQRIAEMGGPLYDRATVSRIENGHRTLSLAEAWDIAEALGVSFSDMCGAGPMVIETRMELA